jgi:hypothetical protein
MNTRAVLHELQFDGSVLRRGFWLYVWEVTPVGQPPLYYVGRTGDSSSTNAQSPFNRMGEHLGFAEKSNMLRKYLRKWQLEPEACSFRLVTLGPLEQESEAVGRAEHDQRRDVVAALEKALAGAMRDVGYRVMNEVSSRKRLDLERFNDVLGAFAEKFPALNASRVQSRAVPVDLTR